ncbi:hypothetical protein P8936_16000 [Edaphobacter paludis]|uniref:Uncharacterized protein n=1 Tax=Edaphobacter paludis TaxID=3035702 RepID=A0AAU7D8L1_9BACT
MKKAGFFSGCLVAIALLGCVSATAFGQETLNSAKQAAPFVPHYYHLAFVVKELEAGKVINSRDYAMNIGTVEHQSMNFNTRSIRNGTRVPIEIEPGKATYIDVGVNIDCKSVMDLDGRLGMEVSADISSVSDSKMQGTVEARGMPMIQQNKWNSQVLVVLGKPTVLFSSDEVTSKRTLQLELTATEIK